ncbi:MAG: MBL fold metallo-hydrolase [Cytophagales bacterium]|nr:MBL fold metallo-hydrolase [Bernardetiaceae bacterium]MDW8205303.1 MBL fold metallo-hydrolase [Cytophagales bacterium]
MSHIITQQILPGLHWVEIPAAGLRLQCGCPPDANKYLRAAGLICEGIHGETGPNAILLADTTAEPYTKGWYPVNTAEFSVMQMLYLQGLIVPNHPNNTGKKPLLIGETAELNRQLRYIYYGNYGLDNIRKLQAAGMNEQEAAAFWYVKEKFAFGAINPITNLIQPVYLDATETVEPLTGCYITRLQPNHFRISYASETVEINLQPGIFPSAYSLPAVHLPNDVAFGILHVGDGDGWDATRPCMGTALLFYEQCYMVDAGPNVWQNWQQTGKTLADIQGVFLTHAHDDHAIGLMQAIHSGMRLPVYCNSVVQAAFKQKMAALAGISPNEMTYFFDFRLLNIHQWQTIATAENGATLQVMPCYSLHPIETHIYYFRYTDAAGNQKTYGHLADILSERGLRAMEQSAPEQSRWLFEQIRRYYYLPADLKKIDIGGGATHGLAEDFISDTTVVKIFAHTHRPLTTEELKIGQARAFGDCDVLQALI